MRTSPRPTPQAISSHYPEKYAPYAADLSEEAPAPSTMRRLRTKLRWDGTRDLLPRMPAGEALEIGCASGSFMRKLRDRGWVVQGIEPSETAAALARDAGFAVHTGPVETAPEFGPRFDLIAASHALEHLHQPLQTLRRLRRWARPDARLTLAVPNAASALFRLFRGAWYDLDVPRHLFHFTPATLKALLHAAGWEVESVRAQGTVNGLVGSVGLWLRDRGSASSRLGDVFLRFPDSRSSFKLLTLPLSFALTLLGQTGRMVVWARARPGEFP
jgi:SAM-dependent methyltransferase